MSYGDIIMTVRCKIQLVEIIRLSLRKTATVVKCSYGPGRCRMWDDWQCSLSDWLTDLKH